MNPKTQRPVRRAEAGFTLVEIMVVIVIIGILATLVVPNVVGSSDEARVKKAQSDCSALATSVKLYRSNKGRLPDSLDALAGDEEKGKSWYLENLPKDPWDSSYELRELDGKDWEVCSAGPDRSMGTEDDISNKLKKED